MSMATPLFFNLFEVQITQALTFQKNINFLCLEIIKKIKITLASNKQEREDKVLYFVLRVIF